MQYIVLLRGINVGGHKKVKMEELRQVLEKAGYQSVSTYIQSGNICLTSEESSEIALATAIASLLQGHFGFEIPTLVRSLSDWQQIIAQLPFGNESVEHLHITLLDKEPEEAALAAIDWSKIKTTDSFQRIGRTIYLHCPNGYGNTKLTNDFWEKKLKCSATTRNWKTTLTLGGNA